MSDSPCPECRVSPCYCDTIVEPTDGGTAQYVRNLRLKDQSHPEPCDHWSPHPKDGFCVACGWAQVVHDIGSPSEHFYNSRWHGAGTEREISGLSQDELWAESTEKLDAFMAEHDRIVSENERLRAFIARLEISIMHPDMGGHHQARVRANGQRLTPEEWAIVGSCGQREPQPRLSGRIAAPEDET